MGVERLRCLDRDDLSPDRTVPDPELGQVVPLSRVVDARSQLVLESHQGHARNVWSVAQRKCRQVSEGGPCIAGRPEQLVVLWPQVTEETQGRRRLAGAVVETARVEADAHLAPSSRLLDEAEGMDLVHPEPLVEAEPTIGYERFFDLQPS
jgi:hypothetical protein